MTDRTPERPRGRRGPAPGTPRGPRLPRAERQAQLVGIAEELFGAHGYHGTTMEAVALGAGITKPVIYDLFGSKDGLLAACLTRARTELFAELEGVWREIPVTDLEGGFRIGILTFFRFIDRHRGLWNLMAVEGPSTSSEHGKLQETRLLHAQMIATRFRSLPSLAVIPGVFVDGVAEGVTGAIERVATWRGTRDDVSAEFATDLVMTLTWHGMSRFIESLPGTGETAPGG